MDTEQQSDEGVLALDADDRDAKRKRRFVRAAEAFQKRAEGSERRWLADLGAAKPKR